MRYLFIIGILLSGPLSFAQLSDQQHQILAGINAYRTELFERDSVDRLLLGVIIEKQRQQDVSPEVLSDLMMRLGIMQARYDFSQNPAPMWFSESIQENPVYQNLTEAEVRIILRNGDMYDLMHEDVLKTRYPYPVSANSKVYDEIAFYNIHDGEHIAEIGAGNGEFAIILGVIYADLDLYINEIRPDNLAYINRKLKPITSIRTGTSIHIVLGEINNPNLPTAYFDKIILRRSLHHFLERKQMLNHIAASLKPDGELLIFENPRVKNAPRQCFYSISDEGIIWCVEKRNFVLIDTLQNGNATYYRFRKRK